MLAGMYWTGVACGAAVGFLFGATVTLSVVLALARSVPKSPPPNTVELEARLPEWSRN